PDWSFPGRGKVRRQLDRAVKGLSAAEKAVAHLPVRGAKADVAAQLEERRTQAERALGYVELYGAYVETEARFDDRRTAALRETGQRFRFVARMLSEAPSLLALDRRARGDFLRHFYRRYDGAPADRLRADAWELFSDLLLEKSFPEGLRRVREHRRLGHRTVLLTGALDFVIEPLRPLFDDVVSATLDERDGRLTGELVAVPPTGEARALLLAQYTDAHD